MSSNIFLIFLSTNDLNFFNFVSHAILNEGTILSISVYLGNGDINVRRASFIGDNYEYPYEKYEITFLSIRNERAHQLE